MRKLKTLIATKLAGFIKKYSIKDMDTFKINFHRMNDTVILPSKRIEDGGVDIYANFEDDYIVIGKGETKLIPTKLKSTFEQNFIILLRERGSTGTKGLRLGAGVIDSGYRGEWFIPINNTSDNNIIIAKKDVDKTVLKNHVDVTVYPYEKAIGQAIAVDNFDWKIKEVSLEAIENVDSVRGEGKIGDSGK